MRRYAVLPRCGLNDEQTVGARCHGPYHGIVQARMHTDTHAKLGRIAAFRLEDHWTRSLYSSEEIVPCVAFVRLLRTFRGSRRLFVAFHGAGTGADSSGPCVSKHPRVTEPTTRSCSTSCKMHLHPSSRHCIDASWLQLELSRRRVIYAS
jgi:hypothetical protein